MTKIKHPVFSMIFMLTWFLASSASGQIQTERHLITNTIDAGYWIFTTDFYSDGDPDILAASLNSGLRWYKNDGAGNFSGFSISGTFINAWAIHAGDMDNDGDQDPVGCSEEENIVSWWQRDGDDNFTENVIDASAGGPHSCYTGDMDNDGDIDVITAAWVSNQILFYENTPGQNFTKHIIDGNFFNGHSIQAIDMDEDGDLDIVAGGAANTAWWENDGDANFTEITIPVDGSVLVFAADVNSDGTMDILRDSRTNFDLNWLSNDGNEVFSDTNIIPAFGETWALVNGDLDLDGDQDLLAAGFAANKVSYFLNDGNENFTEVVLDAAVTRPRGAAIADFDQDGDLDMAAITREDDSIFWYEVLGSPIIEETITLTAPNGGEDLEVGSVFQILWQSTGIDTVDLDYSIDNGANWTNIVSSLDNNGSHNWTIPDVQSSQALVRIRDTEDGVPADTSDAVFSIFKSSLTLTSPNGGESFLAGATHTVTWTSTGLVNQVDLEYSLDNGATFTTIIENAANDGSHLWNLPEVNSSSVLVRISDAADGAPLDVSDNVFTISFATLTITSPNGGETWNGGSTQTIAWTSTGVINVVKLEYSIDNGVNWITIVFTANSGNTVWTVPNTLNNNSLIRSSDSNDPTISDVSDNTFSIVNSSLTITAPNGGEEWRVGSTQMITWSSVGGINQVNLEYSIDNGLNWSEIISNKENDGNFMWTLPNSPSQTALVRIYDATDGTPIDASDASFNITGSTLTLTSPNGGEVFNGLSTQSITWTFQGIIDSLSLEYSLTNGTTWIPIITSTENDGLFEWTVPDIASNLVLVRIFDASDSNPLDISDGTFNIVGSSLNVVEPDGGEILDGNSIQTISWSSAGKIDSVMLEYSFDTGVTWMTIVSKTENDGSYAWQVPDTGTETALVRISDASGGTAIAVSNNVFTIIQSALTLLTPNGGETLLAGMVQAITWSTVGLVEFVKIELKLDDQAEYTTIIESTPNNGSYEWVVPETTGESVHIKISDAVDGTPVDMSDSEFTIIDAVIAVTSPNGGETLKAGGLETITWTFAGNISAVDLEYSLDNGQTWILIEENLNNTGSFRWRLPEVETDSALVRISDAADATPLDISDAVFKIAIITSVSIDRDGNVIPDRFQLFQNYPNPFNPSTSIQFSIPRVAEVDLRVFNYLGETVATLVSGSLPPGEYRVFWQANDLASGTYFYRLQAGGFVKTMKLSLVK